MKAAFRSHLGMMLVGIAIGRGLVGLHGRGHLSGDALDVLTVAGIVGGFLFFLSAYLCPDENP